MCHTRVYSRKERRETERFGRLPRSELALRLAGPRRERGALPLSRSGLDAPPGRVPEAGDAEAMRQHCAVGDDRRKEALRTADDRPDRHEPDGPVRNVPAVGYERPVGVLGWLRVRSSTALGSLPRRSWR